MRRRLIILYPLLFLVLVVLASCSKDGLKTKLNELSKTIENKDYYNRLLEEKMDSARLGLQTSNADSLSWEYAYKLFSNYSYISVDSTYKYLETLRKYSTSEDLKNRLYICEARYLTIIRDFKEVNNYIDRANLEAISDSFKNNYYNEIQRCYATLNDSIQALKLMKEAIECPQLEKGQRQRYIGFIKHYEGDNDSALDEYIKCFNESNDIHLKALAAYNIAGRYKKTNRERYKYWLAESAINDLKVPVKEYSSLYNLAITLYEDNELKTASKFMNVVLDDALKSHYTQRILNSANDYIVIVDALKHSERVMLLAIKIFITCLLTLLVIILALMFRQNRQRRNLADSNKEISILNGQLSDANKIKENYLCKYMNLSVKYLGQVNEMKHQMRKTLKEGGPDALISMIRTPSNHDEYKDFYKIFDETFLSLYPNFVEQVNKLMNKELQFGNKSPLCMEIRILATIRLGFTDSGKIAEFLNCAPNSVYTNRSKLKRFAVCEKDKFEKTIKSLS